MSIHLHYLEWMDDCLFIYLAHMKNYQSGSRKRDPRHIYDNPFDPVICPILCLGIYFATFPINGSKDSSLFPGEHQYERFASYLKYNLKNIMMSLKASLDVVLKT